jgi:flagellar basal-body rod modification protein FlgD
MDSTQFTAQLAQFSSLEQLSAINTSIGKLTDQQLSAQNVDALSYMGKHIKAAGNTLSLPQEGSVSGSFKIGDTAQSVAIGIYDSAGQLVRTLPSGAATAGEHSFTWDGQSSNGQRCAAGTYTIEPLALGLDGKQMDVTTYTLGAVTGVKLSDTGPRLVIGNDGGAEVALSDLQEVVN